MPISEEVSKNVGGFIDTMKEQPLALSLVIMNIFLLAFFFYIAMRTSDTRRIEMTNMQELLKVCMASKQQ